MSETIINKCNIIYAFESLYSTIISSIQKSPGNSSGWISDSIPNPNINTSKYNSFSDTNYVKLPKESEYP